MLITDGCSYVVRRRRHGRRWRERFFSAHRRNWTAPAAQYWSEASLPPATHLFYLPRFYYELCFSFILLLMSCHLLFISPVDLFVLPTAFTFSQILSHIAFLWDILIFLCWSSTTCLFASSTNTPNSMALNFALHLRSLCSLLRSMAETSNTRKTLI